MNRYRSVLPEDYGAYVSVCMISNSSY